jgi:hypothetical protein
MKVLFASLFCALLSVIAVSARAATPIVVQSTFAAEPRSVLPSEEDKDKDKDKDKDGGKKLE